MTTLFLAAAAAALLQPVRMDDPSAVTFKAAEWALCEAGHGLRSLRTEGMRVFTLRLPSQYENGLVISFEARMLKDPSIARDGHVGIDFKNARGETGKLFTRGKGTVLLVKSPGGKEIVSGPLSGSGALDAEAWTRVTVRSGPGHTIATVGGKRCTVSQSSLTPLKSLAFYAYNRHLEIRNLTLSAVARACDGTRPANGFTLAGTVKPGLHPATNAVSAAAGGIMFWARFDPGTELVKLLGADGSVKARLYCHLDTRIHADILTLDTPEPFRRRLFEETTRANDDFHFAFTWREDGTVRFFIDGLPFSVGRIGHEDYKGTMAGNALDGVVAMEVGGGVRGHVQQISDLTILPRMLSNSEVMDAYRTRMPIDLVFEDGVAPADEETRVSLVAAPGGTYTRPTPCEGYPLRTATVDVTLAPERIDETRSAGDHIVRTYTPVPGGTTTNLAVAVTAPRTVATQPLTLPRGKYRMRATVRAKGQPPYSRTMIFSALPPVAPPPVAPSNESWRKTELLWSRTFARPSDLGYGEGAATATRSDAGNYLELGAKGGLNGERRACIVDFPACAKGHPCLLEITWPDDKTRLMGFYMYLESPQRAQHRDRLQGGLACGGVIPLTGKMQTTEYLFFPSSTNHLFEIRTLADGQPAAIASLKVWRLAEPLPVLKVHTPANLPRRRFGHMDEDQTFYMLLNDVAGDDMLDTKARELFRYLAYTGQSAFQYVLFRYAEELFPAEHQFPFSGFFCGEGNGEGTGAGQSPSGGL